MREQLRFGRAIMLCLTFGLMGWGSAFSQCVTLPYAENVNGVVPPSLPACFSQIDDADGSTWESATAPSGFTGNAMEIATNGVSNHDDWIFIGPIGNPGIGTLLRIQWRDGQSASGTNDYEVLVSGAPTPAAGTAFSVTTGAGAETTNIHDELILFGGDIYVGFHATSLAGSPTLYLDDFFLGEVPVGCDQPSAVSATPAPISILSPLATLDVSFTCGGCAGPYEVEYGLSGFVQGVGGTIISSASTTVSIPGLLDFTDYDIYVRQDCGGGNVSFWTSPLSFTTGCGPVGFLSVKASTLLASPSNLLD